MKKLSIQLIVIILLYSAATAQNINHLTYTIVNLNSPIKVVKPGLAKKCDFQINGNMVRAHYETYNGGNTLTVLDVLYDLDKNLRIAFYNDKDYNVELIDSIYIYNTELEATGETKTVRGMKCEKYQLVKAAGTEPNPMVDMVIAKYSVWITKDIQFDKRINKIILKGITKFFSADFEGALVQIDYKVTNPKQELSCDMGLITKDHTNIDSKQYEMPWKVAGGDFKAVVPDPAARSLSGPGAGTPEMLARFKRHKKLLAEVTGNPDTPFKVRQLDLSE